MMDNLGGTDSSALFSLATKEHHAQRFITTTATEGY
jgi:hypothetical protein